MPECRMQPADPATPDGDRSTLDPLAEDSSPYYLLDHDDHIDEDIDPSVACERCAAVCCRLTVLLMPEDRIDARLVAVDERGTQSMAKDEDGWCIALNRDTMGCGIYAQRPSICRDFAMGGPYCRDERASWDRSIAIALK